MLSFIEGFYHVPQTASLWLDVDVPGFMMELRFMISLEEV